MTKPPELPYCSNRRSIRLKDYDYSQAGWYFVTICAKDKACFFGSIENSRMILSDVGNIACRMWQKIPGHYAHVSLDELVIMPNHIHGIIVVSPVGTPLVVSVLSENQVEKSPASNTFSRPIRGSLPVIVQQYKSGVKQWCNQNGFPYFQWQPRFYEHVIRNEDDLNDIRNYIINNPLKWIEDDEYTA